MKAIVFIVLFLVTFFSYSQDEEFIPIDVEGKEAFMSTKTGEYTFLEHAKTDPTKLKTTASGVVYTDIKRHIITKGETLSIIAKKNNVSISEIKKHNDITTSNLKIGNEINIVKRLLIKSSSPTISYAGEERIIASLRPGQSPGQFAAPPSVATVENKVIETKKSEEKGSAKTYKVDNKNIKNPVFGLSNNNDEATVESLEGELKGILEDVNEDTSKSDTVNLIEKNNKAEFSRAAKAEKLRLIKEVAARLEKELEATKKQEIVKSVKQPEAPKTVMPNKIEVIKTKAPQKPITLNTKPNKEQKKVMVFDSSDQEQKNKVEVLQDTKSSKVNYFHKVKSGETYYSISKKYKMSLDALMILNNTKSTTLKVGQKIKIEI